MANFRNFIGVVNNILSFQKQNKVIDRCPNCSSRNIGKIGEEAYCTDCGSIL